MPNIQALFNAALGIFRPASKRGRRVCAAIALAMPALGLFQDYAGAAVRFNPWTGFTENMNGFFTIYGEPVGTLVYHVPDGALTWGKFLIAKGHSGIGDKQDDVTQHAAVMSGPIPRGLYDLGEPQENKFLGGANLPMDLELIDGSNSYGRSLFRIHNLRLATNWNEPVTERADPPGATLGCIGFPYEQLKYVAWLRQEGYVQRVLVVDTPMDTALYATDDVHTALGEVAKNPVLSKIKHRAELAIRYGRTWAAIKTVAVRTANLSIKVATNIIADATRRQEALARAAAIAAEARNRRDMEALRKQIAEAPVEIPSPTIAEVRFDNAAQAYMVDLKLNGHHHHSAGQEEKQTEKPAAKPNIYAALEHSLLGAIAPQKPIRALTRTTLGSKIQLVCMEENGQPFVYARQTYRGKFEFEVKITPNGDGFDVLAGGNEKPFKAHIDRDGNVNSGECSEKDNISLCILLKDIESMMKEEFGRKGALGWSHLRKSTERECMQTLKAHKVLDRTVMAYSATAAQKAIVKPKAARNPKSVQLKTKLTPAAGNDPTVTRMPDRPSRSPAPDNTEKLAA